MFEDLVMSVFMSYLSQYVKDLNRDAVSVSLLRGIIELRNVELSENALKSIAPAFSILRGVIGSLKIDVPFTSIKSKRCEIRVDDVVLIIVPCTSIPHDADAEEASRLLERLAKISILNAMQESLVQGKKKESDKKADDMTIAEKVQQVVINNLAIHINNVTIRYEDVSSCDMLNRQDEDNSSGTAEDASQSRRSVGIAASVHLRQFECFTTNEKFEPSFLEDVPPVCCKIVRCKGLSCFLAGKLRTSDALSMKVDGRKGGSISGALVDISAADFRQLVTTANQSCHSFWPLSQLEGKVRMKSLSNVSSDPDLSLQFTFSLESGVKITSSQHSAVGLIVGYLHNSTQLLAGMSTRPWRCRPTDGPQSRKKWWHHAVHQSRRASHSERSRQKFSWSAYQKWKALCEEYCTLLLKVQGAAWLQPRWNGSTDLPRLQSLEQTFLDLPDVELCRAEARIMTLRYQKDKVILARHFGAPRLSPPSVPAVVEALLGIQQQLAGAAGLSSFGAQEKSQKSTDAIHTLISFALPKFELSLMPSAAGIITATEQVVSFALAGLNLEVQSSERLTRMQLQCATVSQLNLRPHQRPLFEARDKPPPISFLKEAPPMPPLLVCVVEMSVSDEDRNIALLQLQPICLRADVSVLRYIYTFFGVADRIAGTQASQKVELNDVESEIAAASASSGFKMSKKVVFFNDVREAQRQLRSSGAKRPTQSLQVSCSAIELVLTQLTITANNFVFKNGPCCLATSSQSADTDDDVPHLGSTNPPPGRNIAQPTIESTGTTSSFTIGQIRATMTTQQAADLFRMETVSIYSYQTVLPFYVNMEKALVTGSVESVNVSVPLHTMDQLRQSASEIDDFATMFVTGRRMPGEGAADVATAASASALPSAARRASPVSTPVSPLTQLTLRTEIVVQRISLTTAVGTVAHLLQSTVSCTKRRKDLAVGLSSPSMSAGKFMKCVAVRGDISILRDSIGSPLASDGSHAVFAIPLHRVHHKSTTAASSSSSGRSTSPRSPRGDVSPRRTTRDSDVFSVAGVTPLSKRAVTVSEMSLTGGCISVDEECAVCVEYCYDLLMSVLRHASSQPVPEAAATSVTDTQPLIQFIFKVASMDITLVDDAAHRDGRMDFPRANSSLLMRFSDSCFVAGYEAKPSNQMRTVTELRKGFKMLLHRSHNQAQEASSCCLFSMLTETSPTTFHFSRSVDDLGVPMSRGAVSGSEIECTIDVRRWDDLVNDVVFRATSPLHRLVFITNRSSLKAVAGTTIFDVRLSRMTIAAATEQSFGSDSIGGSTPLKMQIPTAVVHATLFPSGAIEAAFSASPFMHFRNTNPSLIGHSIPDAQNDFVTVNTALLVNFQKKDVEVGVKTTECIEVQCEGTCKTGSPTCIAEIASQMVTAHSYYMDSLLSRNSVQQDAFGGSTLTRQIHLHVTQAAVKLIFLDGLTMSLEEAHVSSETQTFPNANTNARQQRSTWSASTANLHAHTEEAPPPPSSTPHLGSQSRRDLLKILPIRDAAVRRTDIALQAHIDPTHRNRYIVNVGEVDVAVTDVYISKVASQLSPGLHYFNAKMDARKVRHRTWSAGPTPRTPSNLVGSFPVAIRQSPSLTPTRPSESSQRELASPDAAQPFGHHHQHEAQQQLNGLPSWKVVCPRVSFSFTAEAMEDTDSSTPSFSAADKTMLATPTAQCALQDVVFTLSADQLARSEVTRNVRTTQLDAKASLVINNPVGKIAAASGEGCAADDWLVLLSPSHIFAKTEISDLDQHRSTSIVCIDPINLQLSELSYIRSLIIYTSCVRVMREMSLQTSMVGIARLRNQPLLQQPSVTNVTPRESESQHAYYHQPPAAFVPHSGIIASSSFQFDIKEVRADLIEFASCSGAASDHDNESMSLVLVGLSGTVSSGNVSSGMSGDIPNKISLVRGSLTSISKKTNQRLSASPSAAQSLHEDRCFTIWLSEETSLTVSRAREIKVRSNVTKITASPAHVTMVYDFFNAPLRKLVLQQQHVSTVDMITFTDDGGVLPDKVVQLERSNTLLHFSNCFYNTMHLDLTGRDLRVQHNSAVILSSLSMGSVSEHCVILVDEGISATLSHGCIVIPYSSRLDKCITAACDACDDTKRCDDVCQKAIHDHFVSFYCLLGDNSTIEFADVRFKMDDDAGEHEAVEGNSFAEAKDPEDEAEAPARYVITEASIGNAEILAYTPKAPQRVCFRFSVCSEIQKKHGRETSDTVILHMENVSVVTEPTTTTLTAPQQQPLVEPFRIVSVITNNFRKCSTTVPRVSVLVRDNDVALLSGFYAEVIALTDSTRFRSKEQRRVLEAIRAIETSWVGSSVTTTALQQNRNNAAASSASEASPQDSWTIAVADVCVNILDNATTVCCFKLQSVQVEATNAQSPPSATKGLTSRALQFDATLAAAVFDRRGWEQLVTPSTVSVKVSQQHGDGIHKTVIAVAQSPLVVRLSRAAAARLTAVMQRYQTATATKDHDHHFRAMNTVSRRSCSHTFENRFRFALIVKFSDWTIDLPDEGVVNPGRVITIAIPPDASGDATLSCQDNPEEQATFSVSQLRCGTAFGVVVGDQLIIISCIYSTETGLLGVILHSKISIRNATSQRIEVEQLFSGLAPRRMSILQSNHDRFHALLMPGNEHHVHGAATQIMLSIEVAEDDPSGIVPLQLDDDENRSFNNSARYQASIDTLNTPHRSEVTFTLLPDAQGRANPALPPHLTIFVEIEKDTISSSTTVVLKPRFVLWNFSGATVTVAMTQDQTEKSGGGMFSRSASGKKIIRSLVDGELAHEQHEDMLFCYASRNLFLDVRIGQPSGEQLRTEKVVEVTSCIADEQDKRSLTVRMVDPHGSSFYLHLSITRAGTMILSVPFWVINQTQHAILLTENTITKKLPSGQLDYVGMNPTQGQPFLLGSKKFDIGDVCMCIGLDGKWSSNVSTDVGSFGVVESEVQGTDIVRSIRYSVELSMKLNVPCCIIRLSPRWLFINSVATPLQFRARNSKLSPGAASSPNARSKTSCDSIVTLRHEEFHVSSIGAERGNILSLRIPVENLPTALETHVASAPLTSLWSSEISVDTPGSHAVNFWVLNESTGEYLNVSKALVTLAVTDHVMTCVVTRLTAAAVFIENRTDRFTLKVAQFINPQQQSSGSKKGGLYSHTLLPRKWYPFMWEEIDLPERVLRIACTYPTYPQDSPLPQQSIQAIASSVPTTTALFDLNFSSGVCQVSSSVSSITGTCPLRISTSRKNNCTRVTVTAIASSSSGSAHQYSLNADMPYIIRQLDISFTLKSFILLWCNEEQKSLCAFRCKGLDGILAGTGETSAAKFSVGNIHVTDENLAVVSCYCSRKTAAETHDAMVHMLFSRTADGLQRVANFEAKVALVVVNVKDRLVVDFLLSVLEGGNKNNSNNNKTKAQIRQNGQRHSVPGSAGGASIAEPSNVLFARLVRAAQGTHSSSPETTSTSSANASGGAIFFLLDNFVIFPVTASVSLSRENEKGPDLFRQLAGGYAFFIPNTIQKTEVHLEQLSLSGGRVETVQSLTSKVTSWAALGLGKHWTKFTSFGNLVDRIASSSVKLPLPPIWTDINDY